MLQVPISQCVPSLESRNSYEQLLALTVIKFLILLDMPIIPVEDANSMLINMKSPTNNDNKPPLPSMKGDLQSTASSTSTSFPMRRRSLQLTSSDPSGVYLRSQSISSVDVLSTTLPLQPLNTTQSLSNAEGNSVMISFSQSLKSDATPLASLIFDTKNQQKNDNTTYSDTSNNDFNGIEILENQKFLMNSTDINSKKFGPSMTKNISRLPRLSNSLTGDSPTLPPAGKLPAITITPNNISTVTKKYITVNKEKATNDSSKQRRQINKSNESLEGINTNSSTSSKISSGCTISEICNIGILRTLAWMLVHKRKRIRNLASEVRIIA